MRIGIVGLLHESNTFVAQTTPLEQFRRGALLEGDSIVEAFASAHHEVGGFLAALHHDDDVDAVPLFVARATPSGVIDTDAYEWLVNRLLQLVEAAGPLDGILAAPHGATVSEPEPDADGAWLRRLRDLAGEIPIVATLDAHANLSPRMVEPCNAIVGYRTNPHLDQRARGEEAARLLVGRLRGELALNMAALFPPLAINIERQCTDEPQFAEYLRLAAQQRENGQVHSNSLLLGFPYADVAEMGTSVLAVAQSRESAAAATRSLADCLWRGRDAFIAELMSVDDAIDACLRSEQRVCLLDMGDNVGGGSPGDGTTLLAAFVERGVEGAFMSLCDPASVERCAAAGVDGFVELQVGGKADSLHGSPIGVRGRVRGMFAGKFTESAPRHGGIVNFDQGAAAVLECDAGPTLLLNSRRTVPFSLRQLSSCELDPSQFRILVAKGVNAPIAAYREVCDEFIRVNTIGSTSADMDQLSYHHRRRPMHPFERDTPWSASEAALVYGA